MGINRIRLQNGAMGDPRVDARMQQTYQENIRRNNAERTLNQMSRNYDFSGLSTLGLNPKTYDSTPGPMRGIPAVGGMREKMIQDIMNKNQPYFSTPPKPTDSLTGMPETMMLPNMTGTSMRSLDEMNAIRDRVLTAQQEQEKQYYLTDPISGKQYKSEQEAINDLGIVTYNQRFATGGRVGFQDGSPEEMVKAQEAAASDPALDAIRQQLFGENYLQDIDQGTGTAQYYTGFGNMPTLDYTPAPVQEVAPVVDTTTPVVDTGGGGGGGQDLATGGVDTGNTDFEYQGTPGGNTGSGEFDLIDNSGKNYGPYTQTMTPMDVKEQYGAIGQYEPYSPTTDTIADAPPSLGFGNPPMTPMDVREQYGALGQYDPGATITGPTGDVYASDDPLAMEKIDFQTPEQTNAIGEAFNSVKDLGTAGTDKFKDSLIALGGKVKEGFDNTIEIGGKTIDLTKSLIGGAISLVSGLPGVGFLLNMLPEGGRSEMSDALGEQYGMDDIGRLTDGPMAGYNVDSLMGKGIEQATIDRINTRKANNLDTKDLENFLEQIERNNLAINYNMEGTDEGDRAAEEAEPEAQDTIADQPPSMFFGNPPLTPMDVKEQYGAIGQYEPYSPTTSFKDQQKAAGDEAAATAREQARDALNAKNAASAAKAAATRREQARADQRGGGGGGGYGGGNKSPGHPSNR